MMFHRQPSLPIDSELLQSLDCDEPDFDAFIEKMTCVTDEIKATASQNISKAQSEQNKYYDRRHSTEVSSMVHDMSTTVTYCCIQELKPGTKVLVENTKQKERKGEDLYIGSFIIHEVLGKGVLSNV